MDLTGRRWISCAEAAELYGLHRKSVLALCRARRIPHTRLPSVRGGRGRIRVDRTQLDLMLEEKIVMAATPAPLDRRRKT